MKALTVRQPWAWAILHGGKDIENRSQVWSYRGLLAIHAGLALDHEGFRDGLLRATVGEDRLPALADEPRGAVLGVVDLVDSHACEDCRCESSWAWPHDATHLVLANPRPLPHPVGETGRLGLWNLPAGTEAVIRRQLDIPPAPEAVTT